MSSLLLGLDCGGCSIRACLVNAESGRMVTAGRAWQPVPAQSSGFFAFDTDTDRCWRLISQAVQEVLAEAGTDAGDILGMAVTGMRFSLVVVGDGDQVVLAVPNHDARSAAEALRLADEMGSELAVRAGHWPLPIFQASRLAWLAGNAPTLLAGAVAALSLGDWVGFKLTGELSTDHSQAAETLLCDVSSGAWMWDVVEHLGVPRRLLPEARLAGTPLGRLCAAAARDLGLRVGTPVAVGGADTQCGLLGAGIVGIGQLGIIAGSTAPLQLVVGRPQMTPGGTQGASQDGRLWTGRHVVSDLWVLESNAGAMGDTLDWFSGVLYPEAPNPLARLMADAARRAPGAGGIMSTLGAQVMDAKDMMGMPIGTLSLTHLDGMCDDVLGSDCWAGGVGRVQGTAGLGRAKGDGPAGAEAAGRAAAGAARRGNLARAILEGMAFAVRANAEQLWTAAADHAARGNEVAAGVEVATRPAGESGGAVHLAGGLSQSAFWAQLLCDVLDRPLAVSPMPEASLLGAAVLAGVGAGVYRDAVEGAARLARPRHLAPDPAVGASYRDLYAEWDRARRLRAPADRVASDVALHDMMGRAAAGQPGTGAATAERLSVGAAAAGRPPVGSPAADAAAVPRLSILATADLDAEALAELRELGDVAHASYRDALRLLTGEDLADELRGRQVLITEVDIVDAAALAGAADLRVVAVCRSDTVNVDVAACTALGIPVLRTPGRNADAVADLTLTFILMLLRKMPDALGFLRAPGAEAGDMGRMGQAHADLLGNELWGKTVGLIGFGAVGRAVARRLRPFGARVIVCDPNVSAEDVLALDAESVSLDELLAAGDIVSLHAPANDRTLGMMSAERLAHMKPGAFLVNTAKAALVREDALFEALRSGRLGGAALDVFAAEPPGADDPLLSLPDVIATPHLGGNTVEVGAHQGRIVVDDLRRLRAGTQPLHIVNPEVLAGFSWYGERRRLSAAELAELSTGAAPAVTDVQRAAVAAAPAVGGVERAAAAAPAAGDVERAAAAAPAVGDVERAAAGGPAPARELAGPAAATAGPNEAGPAAAQMERVLDLFLERARLDDALLKYAANRDLSSHYIASDLGPQFFLWFRDGAVQAGLGPPPERAHVRLKAKAEILDGILTGRVNGNRAAMTGKLSFSGDVRLAMGMQRIQKDLIRLYTAAREDVGGLDLAAPEQAAAAVKTIPESRAAEAPVPQATAAAPEAARAAPASIHSGASATPAADELRREVAAVAEELFAARLITPTGGNVSARVPGAERAWITPSQLFKGGLTPEMMVLVDLDGEALDPDAAAPSSERLLHTAIYKARPDVQAVIHSHGVYATILGMSELPFLPVTTEAAFFDEIPRVAFTMPGSGDLADAVREALGNGTAVLLQNHGLVVAADSLRQAANAAAAVEEACQIIWSCEAVGKHPPTLPDDVVATLREIGRMIG